MTGELMPALVRGLILLTLLLLVGQATAASLVARADVSRSVNEPVIRGWMSRLPGLLAWFLLGLSMTRGALQVLAFSDPGAPVDPELARYILTEGKWGTGWMIQTLGAFILLALTWLLRNKPLNLRLTTAGFAILFAAAQSGLGHANDAWWPVPLLGHVVHCGHIVGAGLWVGTLAVLGIAVFPSLRGEEDRAILGQVLAEFSVVARSGAAVAVISGVAAVWVYGGTLVALPQSTWGKLLLGKLLLLLGVAVTGFWNWRRVTPRLMATPCPSTRQLDRAIAIELLLALGIVAVTAVLVASELPVGMLE